ncbi:MAG: polyphosphate kinase 2 family protein [Burkholderiales bacterium]|nr:polyphosphate kinase 2 family protein [Burkholderiales bacterium]
MAKKSEDVKIILPIIANGKTKLAAIDPRSTCNFSGDKAATVAIFAQLNAQLVELQEVLYAENKHKLLVVLQATDTGGKDGVIRKVFSGVNPSGVHVASFKAPTPDELEHDYLWRVHQRVPGKGEMVIFNRSHYEDVLITRVEGWIDDRAAKRRFRQINDFEAMLVEEGTIIIKFFLHISKEEQKERLQDRLDDKAKNWKFNPGDLVARGKWDEYQRVYEEAINATSSPHAPWHIVPADRNWVRDLYVCSVIVSTLRDLKMRYPDPAPGLEKIVIK